MRNFRGNATRLALATSILAGGCSATSSPEQEQAYPVYNDDPSASTDMSAGDCYRDSHSLATKIDDDVTDIDRGDRTLGLYGVGERFVVGAIIRARGNGSYLVTTSKGKTFGVEDIREQGFAEVIESTGSGFDAVLSSRYNPEDKSAYFVLNCLPDFDFHGDAELVPLEDIPHYLVPIEPNFPDNPTMTA